MKPGTRATLIKSLRDKAQEEAPLVASWPEDADQAAYLIRRDGHVLGVGRAQLIEEGILEELPDSELAQAAINLISVANFEDETGTFLSLAHMQWLEGGAFHEGPYLAFTGTENEGFDQGISLAQTVQWRTADDEHRRLFSGTECLARRYSPTQWCIPDPDGAFGLGLVIPESMVNTLETVPKHTSPSARPR